MKTKELREKSNAELIKDKSKLVKDLNEMRFKKVISVLENPLKMRTIRREIARINTILYEREIEKIRSGNLNTGENK
ncbi:MAG: 50S ribosomal protein L29 [Spirochaetes bacterium]|nr:50S ribosomal protein L29 [Spirochaetota bacterium]